MLQSASRGVPGPGGVCSWRVPGQGGGWVSQHALRQTSLPPCGQTHPCKTRMHSSRMRTTRSLIISLYLIISHACPPRATHMPPRATMHAPPEQACTPPRASMHAPKQPCMPPLEQPCTPLEQPCMPPPRATTHAP